MQTRRVTVIDLDDGDQIKVNVQDTALTIVNGYKGGPFYVVVERPHTDGRSLQVGMDKTDGTGTVIMDVCRVGIDPVEQNSDIPKPDALHLTR